MVSAFDAAGNVYDVTEQCHMAIVDPAVAQVEVARVTPKADGKTQLEMKLGELTSRTEVEVTGAQTQRPIAFENEALVALSKQNCNSGACHGSPSGKGGFRLSLRAFDVKLDELTLTQEEFGRRLNLMEPEKSLLLEKPLMLVAHGGGVQLRKSNVAYGVLRDWLAQGAKVDAPNTPRITRVEIFPKERRVLRAPYFRQQLAVIAHYADGQARDVTRRLLRIRAPI